MRNNNYRAITARKLACSLRLGDRGRAKKALVPPCSVMGVLLGQSVQVEEGAVGATCPSRLTKSKQTRNGAGPARLTGSGAALHLPRGPKFYS